MSERIELRGDFLTEFLRALCDASQAVMITLEGEGESRRPMPVRMLALEGTTLIVDVPRRSGKAVEVDVGTDAAVECGLDVGLLRFRCVVRGRVKDGTEARLALGAPEMAEVLQRRAAYRVMLLETAVTARLWPAHRGTWLVDGTVLNASAIGAAVVVEREEAARFKIDEVCQFIFEAVADLPELRVVGKVIRQAAGPVGHKLLVGVSWRLREHSRDERALQDQLARFVAARQRPILRRRSYRLPKE